MQSNYLGMNASDYGGGTPIIDVWRRDVGIGIGDLEPGPRLISLPVSMPDAKHVHIAVTYKHEENSHPARVSILSEHLSQCIKAIISRP